MVETRNQFRCQAAVYKPGEWRHSRGYGAYRSEERHQCKRMAIGNTGLCKQHGAMGGVGLITEGSGRITGRRIM